MATLVTRDEAAAARKAGDLDDPAVIDLDGLPVIDLDGLPVIDLDGLPVIGLGRAEIWDGTTLFRLRGGLSRLIERGGRRRVGVDLSRAGVLPPGTFGLLADFADGGAEVLLVAPRPQVRAMTWFRRFAAPAGPGVWRLTPNGRGPGGVEAEDS